MINFGKATILVSIICSLDASTQLPRGVDRYAYCESCLATTQEMETIERKLSLGSRPQLVERMIDDVLCESASFQTHSHLPVDQLRAACKHLLDVHGEEFRDALLRRESERLDILLCYESSLACVGVKRHTDQNKNSFTDNDMEALLQQNSANLRTARPVHTNITKTHLKDEL
ncbi:hypothetical protein SKAU_G00302660 [Synaphobranchus kaupii]|uniref:Saposin B-type domain-containing protein n=1 Tax=Synaphobranchus kaupii TaxID=118154 RepID=A0A9Q1EVZ6_SYNKA|nr:hypothetical protein SKAU_G00302660 [Synaphobranchus kaupii]